MDPVVKDDGGLFMQNRISVLLTLLFAALLSFGPGVPTWSFAADAPKKEAPRGFLGIQMQDVSGGDGVNVTKVVPNQPAQKGGMKPEDVVTAFNDKPINSMAQLMEVISGTPPNTVIKLTVRRGTQKQDLSITTGKRPTFNPVLVQDNPPRVDGGTWELEDVRVLNYSNSSNLIVSEEDGRIDGSFEQTYLGLLDVEINQRENHAAMEVTGDVTLSGILYVGIGKVKPRDGDEFVIIRNAASIKGEFGKVMLPKLPDGLRWKVVYDDLKNGVDLNGNGKHDVTLLVLKEGSGSDRP